MRNEQGACQIGKPLVLCACTGHVEPEYESDDDSSQYTKGSEGYVCHDLPALSGAEIFLLGSLRLVDVAMTVMVPVFAVF